MTHTTLIETGLNLMLIGWLLFLGFILGNAFVEYIEHKADQAAKKRNGVIRFADDARAKLAGYCSSWSGEASRPFSVLFRGRAR
jgi:hypothetical protein